MAKVEFKGCTNCIHFQVKGFKCIAFPKGIPSPIATGVMAHTKVLPYQEGNAVWTPPQTEED